MPPRPRQEGAGVIAGRILCASAFVVGVFALPPGDRLWPAAVVLVAGPSLLSGLRLPLGSPSGLWLGAAIFEAAAQFLSLPYRPGYLFGVLAGVVTVGYGIMGWRALRRGEPVRWVALGLGGSAVLAAGVAVLGWTVLAAP